MECFLLTTAAKAKSKEPYHNSLIFLGVLSGTVTGLTAKRPRVEK